MNADELIAAVEVDLLAYDGADGTALPGETLVLSIDGAMLARPEAVLDGGPIWDTLTGREIEVVDSAESLEIQADDMGAVRVVVLIDRFETRRGCYEPIELLVEAAQEQLTIPIAPRMPCR